MRRAACAACAAGVALAIAASAPAAGAQDVTCGVGDTEVHALRFTGNRTFPDAVLANGIVTTPSSWVRRAFRVIGARRCVDGVELRRDSLRLVLFYRNHGFPQVRVGLRVDTIAPRRIDITFPIREGQPLRVERLTIRGLDSLSGRTRLVADLPIRAGGRFDQYAVEAARDTLARRLRDDGWPMADVLRSFATDTAQHTATVEFDAAPGPRARIGALRIVIDRREGGGDRGRAQVDSAVARRVTGLHAGDVFRARDLEAATRNLYLTDAFQHVEVGIDTTSIGAPGDSSVDVVVTLTEGLLHSVRGSVGWGTLDCFRAQADYADLNFLRGLRRLDVSGRLSKIGVGVPLDHASELCSAQVRSDPYSDTLNYYVGTTVRQSTVRGRRIAPTVTLYSERRSEYKAFFRSTPVGALASVTWETRPRVPMTYAYQLEYGRTEAQDAIFCAVFNICEAADREQLTRLKRSAAVSWSVTRTGTDNLVNPSSGTVLRFTARHASQLVGSDREEQFNKALADASWYQPLGGGHVLVARLRLGWVLSIGTVRGGRQFVPPQERLYAGGPSTVRGYAQNELGPLVYIPTRYDTVAVGPDTVYRARPEVSGTRAVPTGGNALAVANLEARLRSPVAPQLVQFAIFTDAGQVWNRGAAGTGVGFGALRVTPGAGVGVFTPVGPVRVDVGYNPYARTPGPAYYSAPNRGAVTPLYCVSPGNTLKVIAGSTADVVAVQEPGRCPATYAPAQGAGFVRRLTFHISIGQPF